ncbi:hypothetical protein CL176_05830 [Suicoccus acidiformans]|uniref:LysM domain-containing protein n=1 Tax=Suicoccus acidiformans TaxID=2036206 RepID=A0A347WKE4_9LACT|nr:LysM peptidoglycan-binding domain-containing protein [Suicoccus acidiformans]AXY25551.1 hypothetical protein CL176_05830 [Suicoccus acidiformans]
MHVATPTTQAPANNQSVPQQTANQSHATNKTYRGDYLNRIAQQNGVTVAQLKQWNNLSSNLIHPGDRLVVSAPSSTQTATSAPQTTPTTPASQQTPAKSYTVRPDDYLYRIASANGVTVERLK